MKANKAQRAKRNFVLRIPNTAEGELFYNLFRNTSTPIATALTVKLAASGVRANSTQPWITLIALGSIYRPRPPRVYGK